MSTGYVRFAVKLLPARHTNDQERLEDQEPVQTFAIGARRAETFGDLCQKVQARYNARRGSGEDASARVDQLQDSSGAEILEEDDVGSLYEELPAGRQHTLYARILESELGRSTTKSSDGEGHGLKRRASDGPVEDEGEGVKRKKLQSPEDLHDSRATVKQTDADGFRIPQWRDQGNAKVRGVEPKSSSTVLVEDSQPETGDRVAGSAFAKLRQREGLNRSSPATRSSPLVHAASRNATDSGRLHKALPTPDSRDHHRTEANDETPNRPTPGNHQLSSWFRRPTHTTMLLKDSAAEEDPIEDLETAVRVARTMTDEPGATIIESDRHGKSAARDHARTYHSLRRPDVNRQLHLQTETSDRLRTPSAQRSKSNRTDGSHAPSSSRGDTIKNSARSVKNSWTQAEDEALLKGLSRPRAQVSAILTEYKIARTSSAARSRIKLLMQNQRGQQSNTLDFPSSSLAMPQPESDEEPEHLNATQKTKSKIWSQHDVGVLRKAIGEGFQAQEMQAEHFPNRTQEAVSHKIRDLRDSVIRLEKEKDSFPKDTFRSNVWTDLHNLRLRRAYREGLTAVAAGSRYFKSMSKTLIEQKMKAYRLQMEDLAVERAISQQSQSGAADEEHRATADAHDDVAGTGETGDGGMQQDQDALAGDDPQQTQEEVDAEILRDLEELDADDDDGPVIQDSCETASAVPIASSPPLLRRPAPRSSPEVRIPLAEQRQAREAQLGCTSEEQDGLPQMRRSTSSGGQMQLNFKRDKGKAAVRPAVNIDELDRQYSRPFAFRQTTARVHVADDHPIDGRSNEDKEITGHHGSDNDAVSSIAKASRGQQSIWQPSPPSAASEGDATVSSDGPNRQLTFELEQSLSAPEQSLRSETAPTANEPSAWDVFAEERPTAYVHIPSPRRGAATSKAQQMQWQESDGESDAFQTQDPMTTLSQKLQRPKASPRGKASSPEDNRAHLSVVISEDESVGFQTQDPSTTLSQKQQVALRRKGRQDAKAGSMFQDAVDRFEASQDVFSLAGSASNDSAARSANTAPKPRRNVYEVPVSSQPAIESGSQRRSEPLLTSSSEKRGAGKLPRILGPASRLAQRARDAEAKHAARKAEKAAVTASWASCAASAVREKGVRSSPMTHEGAMANQSLPDDKSVLAHHVDVQTEETGLSHADELSPLDGTCASSTLNAGHSHESPSQSQITVQPVVELPYPQILSREPGEHGKVEVGRPGYSFKVPHDCVYLRSDEVIAAAAAREATGERAVKRLAEDMRLGDQQGIAMCCNDSDKLKDLRKLERRHRRERRVEDGLPPSRGPAQQNLPFGLPKPIQWDVEVMPDSDDSMSSRGRDVDDEESEASQRLEADDNDDDDDENPAYFDKDRHFSEVEEENSNEKQNGPNRIVAAAEDGGTQQAGGAGQNDKDGPLEPLRDAFSQPGPDRFDGGQTVNVPLDSVLESAAASNIETGVLRSFETSTKQDSNAQAHQSDNIADSHAAEGESEARAPSAVLPILDSPGKDCVEGELDEEEDSVELPTGPPPVSDEVDGASELSRRSDRELQDLVQSGEVEVNEGAPGETETRWLPGLGSPGLTSQEGGPRDLSLATTTSSSPINTRRADESTPQYWRRRNASPNRTPHVTDSMLPPWPSSGKVRSSLEILPNQSPSVTDCNMASKKDEVQAGVAGTVKKRKHEMTTEQYAEYAVSRKARKKRRMEARRASRQSLDNASAATKPASVSNLHGRVEKPHEAAKLTELTSPVPMAATAHVTSKKNHSKEKKTKKHRLSNNSRSHGNFGTASVEQNDRKAIPPPVRPPQHVRITQQSSLPSPDSEISAKAAKSSAKKRARKRAKREARRSAMSVSAVDSPTSDASIAVPVSSSPLTLAAKPADGKTEATRNQPPSTHTAQSRDAVTDPPTTSKSATPLSKPPKSTEASRAAPALVRTDVSISKPASKSTERPASRAKVNDAKMASAEETTKSPSQPSQSPSAQTNKPVVKSTETPDARPVGQTKPASQQKSQPKSTSTERTPTSEASAHASKSKAEGKKGGASKPAAVGAKAGLEGLIGFQVHIPAAPKPRPQAEKTPVKPSMFFDDDEEDSSESSSDSE